MLLAWLTDCLSFTKAWYVHEPSNMSVISHCHDCVVSIYCVAA